MRDAVARRDRGVCQNCGSHDRVQKHHIRPLAEGGPDIPQNMISLCWSCHEAAHRYGWVNA